MKPRPKQNIMFIKTQRCGSSTIQNILMRYGLEKHLYFVLPEDMGSPHEHFKAEIVLQNMRNIDGKYNILAHRARYDPVEIKKLLPPVETLYVTILRDPAAMFESMYNFYHLDLVYESLTLIDILNSSYSNNKEILGHRSPIGFGLNQMSFDLGLNESMFDNEEAIEDFIILVRQDFDLVMITEYMEVSLVLLADLMDWPLERVVHLNHMMRQESKVHQLEEADKTLLRDLNLPDHVLYKYFLEELKKKIGGYGIPRMQKQVAKLINLNNEFSFSCVEEVTVYDESVSYLPKQVVDSKCKYAAMSEFELTENLREFQNEKARALHSIDQIFNIDVISSNKYYDQNLNATYQLY